MSCCMLTSSRQTWAISRRSRKILRLDDTPLALCQHRWQFGCEWFRTVVYGQLLQAAEVAKVVWQLCELGVTQNQSLQIAQIAEAGRQSRKVIGTIQVELLQTAQAAEVVRQALHLAV